MQVRIVALKIVAVNSKFILGLHNCVMYLQKKYPFDINKVFYICIAKISLTYLKFSMTIFLEIYEQLLETQFNTRRIKLASKSAFHWYYQNNDSSTTRRKYYD